MREVNFCLILAIVIWDLLSFTAHRFDLGATSEDTWQHQETFLVVTTGELFLVS